MFPKKFRINHSDRTLLTPGCCLCQGGEYGWHYGISAFVKNERQGKKIINRIFSGWGELVNPLGYQGYEIQLGFCNECRPLIKEICAVTQPDNLISRRRINGIKKK